jgi:tetratricopeptide (TPR) repeat protein
MAMKMISRISGRGAVAACIMLSACATAGPSGAADYDKRGDAYGAFLAARYADAQNDPAAATTFYMQALRADPNNQALIAEGFLAALMAGSPQAQVLATQVPSNTLAALLRGNQAALNGDFAQAGLIFGALPQDDLMGLVKPLLLAWTQFGRGDAQGALAGLGPYFNSATFGAVYVLNAAVIADAAHDEKDATQLYGAVGSDQPNLRLAQFLASFYARQGKTVQAEQVLAALAAAHPDLQIALPALQANISKPVVRTATQGMAEAYLTLAGSLGQPSQVVLRTIFLRAALMLRPDLTAARLLLAGGQAGNDPAATPTAQQLQNALDTLQPIRSNDPLYAPAALQEANLLAALNRPKDAVALLDRLIAATPGNAGLLASAGDVLRDANQPAAAIPYYDKAIAAAGTPAPAGAWTLYFDRGICEDQLGNWPAAQPDVLRALALAPNQPYLLNYLGYSWAMRGEKLDEAKHMLQQAVGLDPNDGAVMDSLGFVDIKQGETAAAVALLTQAVQLDPDDAEVNAHLGDAFWQAGQKLQADYQWQRALALNPDAKLRGELTGKLQQYFAPPA